ncbi:MAG: phospho-sugar mutase, partial [Alkalispirochaetaceae bacterium]
MERDDIKGRAEAYLRQEKNETFTREVEELLHRGDWEELEDRFYTDLEFGTGGLRGVIGGGYNRMNPFVVGRATTGFARYVNEFGDPDGRGGRSVAIAYDSRRYSREFALQAARVFAAHEIKAYLFSSLRPTPELSFAVRQLNCSCGLVITASHNPPQYNGYKVYWSDGSQVVAPHDKGIIDYVMKVEGEIPLLDEDEATSKGLIEEIDEPIDTQFTEMVKRTAVRPQLLKERGNEVTAVYTPLHGTGAMMVERVLGEFGVTVHTVAEQREPDGEFPTVTSPNPEEASALEMALELGRQKEADIVIGTDPDADRIGIAVPVSRGGELRLVTGNQLGVLFADYVLSGRKEQGTLPEKPVFIKTIVTTELQREVAQHYGAIVYDTLTGFKHIASVMREL